MCYAQNGKTSGKKRNRARVRKKQLLGTSRQKVWTLSGNVGTLIPNVEVKERTQIPAVH